MNRRYAIVSLNGASTVAVGTQKRFAPVATESFRLDLKGENDIPVERVDENGEMKTEFIPLSEYWLDDRGKRKYGDVVFDPRPWRDFSVATVLRARRRDHRRRSRAPSVCRAEAGLAHRPPLRELRSDASRLQTPALLAGGSVFLRRRSFYLRTRRNSAICSRALTGARARGLLARGAGIAGVAVRSSAGMRKPFWAYIRNQENEARTIERSGASRPPLGGSQAERAGSATRRFERLTS